VLALPDHFAHFGFAGLAVSQNWLRVWPSWQHSLSAGRSSTVQLAECQVCLKKITTAYDHFYMQTNASGRGSVGSMHSYCPRTHVSFKSFEWDANKV